MWVRIFEILIYCGFLMIIKFYCIKCHVPNYASTPSNKVEQLCILSESCVHDTIAVCGRMGEEKRTFLDLCDMLEFGCDTNMIFTHVEDEENCPKVKQNTL